MQCNQITIAGVTRFAEPVTLDLTEIPEGSLVAIVGENGEGKTTLLDSILAPVYLTMVSRRGKLATYATGERSVLEGIYQVDDQVVRARVNVDGKRRETKAVLEVSTAEGGRLVTDGGVKAYQAQVGRMFPPLELALASAFAPQNRAGSFVTATSAERKSLFGVCLGLEQYAEWAETAAKAANLVRTVIARLDGRRGVLAGLSSIDAKAALLERLEDVGGRIAALELEQTGAEVDRAALAIRLDALAADLETQARAEEAHRAAQEAATRAAEEGVTLLRDQKQNAADASLARDKVERSRVAAHEVVNRSEVMAKASRAQAVAEPQKRIEGNQALQKRATEIRAAGTAKRAAEANIATDRAKEREYQTALDEAQEALEIDLRNLGPLETAETKLEAARLAVAIIDRVPCQGRTFEVGTAEELAGTGLPILDSERIDCSACQFLQDAKAAGATIAELEERVLLLPTARKARDARQAVIAGLRQSLGICRRQVEVEEANVRRVAELAAYEPELEKVEERVAGYRREIDQADRVLAERLLELEERRSLADNQARALLAELETLQATVLQGFEDRRLEIETRNRATDFKLREAAAEVARTTGAREEHRETRARLETYELLLRRLEGDLATARAAMVTVEEELAALALHARELAGVEVNLEAARQEVLVWELLARCFNRDGLPTLEIANAGPTVSSLTNDLLEIAFGPRFSVDVLTQVPTADGKGTKEEFTIRVYDNEAAGAVRDIADLSGGERVLVEEALRAAIMVFVNAQNRTPFRTICRDETTGALDPDNAVRYVAMLRRLVTLAGAAHCLFITHNPQCAELADVIVTVADGRLDVRRTAA